jgi:PAS domain S-box-containing protein
MDIRLLVIGRIALLAVAYAAAALCGLALTQIAGQVSAVWPASGVGLAGLLLLGPRAWPAITLGALVANATVDQPLGVAAGIAVGNTLEALVGVWLLRAVRFDARLPGVRDVVALIFLGACVASTVAATNGVLNLMLWGVYSWESFTALWGTWWLGDAAGIVAVTPVILAWAARPRLGFSFDERVEFGLMLAAGAAIALLVYSSDTIILRSLRFTVLPLVVWAGLRFTLRETATLLLVVAAIAIGGTVGGYGEFFVHPQIQGPLTLVVVFFSMVMVSSLVLAAAIEERRQADASRRQQHALLEAVAAGTSDIIFVKDTRGRYLMMNAAGSRFFGVPADQLVGRRDADLFPAEVARQLIDADRQVMQTGSTITFEEPVVRGDNEFVYLTIKAPFRDADGRMLGIVGIAHDITDRRRQEDRIRRSEEVLADFVENAAMGLHWVGRDGTILWANRTELEMLGYQRDEYVGKNIAQFHVDERVIKDILRRLTSDEPLHGHEARMRCKNGAIKHVLIYSNVLRESGDFVHTRCFTQDVTDRKLAQEALAASERRFRSMIEKSWDAVVLFDAQGTFTYTTPSVERIIGYTSDEMIGRNVFELMHPDDLPITQQLLFEILSEPGTTRSAEFRYRHKNGSYRWIEGSGTNLLHDPTVRAIVGNYHDITIRKQAQEALRESQAQLEFTLQAVSVGIWDWDVATGQVRWSGNLEKLHRLPQGSFGGTYEDFANDIHPEDRPRVEAMVRRALDGMENYRTEYRLAHVEPDVWIETIGRVIRDRDGRPMRMTGICMDVTERRRAEERFREAVEGSPIGKVIVDSADRIVLVNASTEKLFGYLRSELIGQSVDMLVPEKIRELYRNDGAAYFSMAGSRPMDTASDLYGRRKDGSDVPIEIGLNPIHTPEGPCVLISIIDITERKRFEQALRETNAELIRRTKEVEQFVYTVSHDLKSPLVTTLGFVGMMKQDLAAGDQDQLLDSLGRIERAAQRMNELIEDLLQLSRIGRLRHDPEIVDVVQLVRQIGDDLAERLEQAGALLVIQEPMPPIMGDRARLVEVFENLLVNAIKYGCCRPEGATQSDGQAERVPRIVVGSRTVAGETRFFVEDNGPGIDLRFHQRIFGMFQRLGNDQPGTGVGLAIVERIMQVHNGRVWVESEPGRGATFWLVFNMPSLASPDREPGRRDGSALPPERAVAVGARAENIKHERPVR